MGSYREGQKQLLEEYLGSPRDIPLKRIGRKYNATTTLDCIAAGT